MSHGRSATKWSAASARGVGGLPVHLWFRYRFSLICSVCIILMGGVAALACVSHPVTHERVHSLLCLDADNPGVQSDNSAKLLTEGRTVRFPSSLPISIISPATFGADYTLIPRSSDHACFWAQEIMALPACGSFQPVLRL